MATVSRRRSKGKLLACFIVILYLVSPYLNLLPVAFADKPASSPPVQPLGTPLPPGSVTFTNTWNSSSRSATQSSVLPTSSFTNAALSQQTWSKPGLTPYETVFTHGFSDTNEYFSPGSGLLTVVQNDLNLPQRRQDYLGKQSQA